MSLHKAVRDTPRIEVRSKTEKRVIMSKRPKATTRVSQIGGPAADFGGTESDATTTPNEKRHTSKADRLHQVGLARAGNPAIQDYSNAPNKLSRQSAAISQRGEDNNQGIENRSPRATGFQSTGSDLSGSNKYGRAQ